MNYLSELKAFYDRLELNPLPSPAIALWHALMSIANKTGWQEEFTAAVSVLVLKSGLNAQAIKRARNRLEQDGYITWRSRAGNQSAVYHINSLVVQNTVENVPQFVPQIEPQTVPQCEPQFEPQTVPINKQKQNETKNIPPKSPMKAKADTRQIFDTVILQYTFSEPVRQKLEEWILYKIERKEPYKEQGLKALLTQVKNKIALYGDTDVCDLIGHCMASSWKGIIWDLLEKKENGRKNSGKNQFNNFQQRKYDYAELEKELLETR